MSLKSGRKRIHINAERGGVMKKYILAADQGTTSCRAILFNESGGIEGISQKEFTQIFPKAGWVEHDAEEIWRTQLSVIRDCLYKNNVIPQQIEAIGITNQRETTVVWDRETGKPVYNAIVWQSRQSEGICGELKNRGLEGYIKENTGLLIDPYFSATKIKWILDNVPGAREKAESGRLIFGTMDTWLIWNLTGGKLHITDYSNASRTMLYNIRKLEWDKYILDELGIFPSMLPAVVDSSGICGYTDKNILNGAEIPISGIAGDQQASLFGQCCFEEGTVKNTYGTGCFMLMNTGNNIIKSENGLVTTIAWGIGGKVEYALEGSIFIAGAVIQWLRDELGMIKSSRESEYCAQQVKDSEGVYVVPAFTGLGTPYWDSGARGVITGLTRGAGRNHIVRAALEGIAFQVYDVVRAMEKDCGFGIKKMHADGGASANNFLMQFQADILNCRVERCSVTETTALGVAFLAGIATGFWKGRREVETLNKMERVFTPEMDRSFAAEKIDGWKRAVDKAKSF